MKNRRAVRRDVREEEGRGKSSGERMRKLYYQLVELRKIYME